MRRAGFSFFRILGFLSVWLEWGRKPSRVVTHPGTPHTTLYVERHSPMVIYDRGIRIHYDT